MMKLKKESRYYLSSIISLVIFMLLALMIYYKWTNDYNERLKNIEEYKAGLRESVERDPIRQLVYPFFYIPCIAFIYGLLEGKKKYRYIIPLIAGLVAFLIYYAASDGGEHLGEGISSEEIFATFIPSIIGALAGIEIIRIISNRIKVIKSKNKK